MSHSAPQPNPLESDSDPSLSPKMISEDEIVREARFFVFFFEICKCTSLTHFCLYLTKKLIEILWQKEKL